MQEPAARSDFIPSGFVREHPQGFRLSAACTGSEEVWLDGDRCGARCGCAGCREAAGRCAGRVCCVSSAPPAARLDRGCPGGWRRRRSRGQWAECRDRCPDPPSARHRPCCHAPRPASASGQSASRGRWCEGGSWSRSHRASVQNPGDEALSMRWMHCPCTPGSSRCSRHRCREAARWPNGRGAGTALTCRSSTMRPGVTDLPPLERTADDVRSVGRWEGAEPARKQHEPERVAGQALPVFRTQLPSLDRSPDVFSWEPV